MFTAMRSIGALRGRQVTILRISFDNSKGHQIAAGNMIKMLDDVELSSLNTVFEIEAIDSEGLILVFFRNWIKRKGEIIIRPLSAYVKEDLRHLLGGKVIFES